MPALKKSLSVGELRPGGGGGGGSPILFSSSRLRCVNFPDKGVGVSLYMNYRSDKQASEQKQS